MRGAPLQPLSDGDASATTMMLRAAFAIVGNPNP